MPVISLPLMLLQAAALSASGAADSARQDGASVRAMASATIVHALSAREAMQQRTPRRASGNIVIDAPASVRRRANGAVLVEYR